MGKRGRVKGGKKAEGLRREKGGRVWTFNGGKKGKGVGKVKGWAERLRVEKGAVWREGLGV